MYNNLLIGEYKIKKNDTKLKIKNYSMQKYLIQIFATFR